MKKRSARVKFTVLIGYVLVISVMAFGLIILYNNLVDYADKKINSQDLSELLIVSNTLSLLYEIESEQNLFTAENASQYFHVYDSITPVIHDNLERLKEVAIDSIRVVKIDSIELLVGMKKENLQVIAVLMDSLRQNPRLIREVDSRYVPKELNREISAYLGSKNLSRTNGGTSDTTVVAGERKRFVDRVRNVFDGRADSTIVIENRSVVADKKLALIVDTIINKVRYSERLDLAQQRRFQEAFLARQEVMSQTNRMLTGRIDDLLKEIEKEEMAKSLQLLIDKEEALSRSGKTMRLAALLGLVIALVFAILFLVDINRSQRYRKQLEASNKQVSDLLAARERLMLTISHDIKAPMSSILGYVELMENDIGQYDKEREKSREYLANMQQSGEHVLQLVSTLLDFHKLESGAWKMKELNVDLPALLDEIVLSFKPLAERKGLEYKVDNQLARAVEYRLDPYVLREVISNLISNAIKYTSRGSVSIAAHEEEKEGSRLVFRVTDTGSGIGIEDQQVIFQDFKQLDSSPGQPERIEGSGLGLAITKAFVEELGGTIRVESEKESGSEFIVELPLQPVNDSVVLEDDSGITRKKKAAFREEIKEIEGLSVLVVDDDPVQLNMTAEMLRLAGVEAVTEECPVQAYRLIEEQFFDLLLVDLQMPGLDGIGLVEKMRRSKNKTFRELPVIALSARSGISELELQQAGFNGFLTKPFSSGDLYATILYHKGEKRAGSLSPVKKSPSGKISGVQALIDFVQDNKEASLSILGSFAQETTLHIDALKVAFAKDDLETAAEIAHTILPLVRIIGGETAISCLERFEKKESPRADEREALLVWLEQQVNEAEKLSRTIESSPGTTGSRTGHGIHE